MYERHHVTRGILGFVIGSPAGILQGNAQQSHEMQSGPTYWLQGTIISLSNNLNKGSSQATNLHDAYQV
jgi:hypothetical protein